MEKLIELLKEYDNEEFWEALYMENKVYANDFLIISKKYWFIKWLVENEKIDLDGYPDIDFFNGDVNNLLMYLAIQDNPIEFLVSILK